jgi:flavorubredoxin
MAAIEIAPGIYSVGATDWNIRDFHGYSTFRGSTYNAYLIVDEKIALVDTVKKEHVDELLANISRIVDPKKIDYMISNHTEMDHSGGLPRVMHKIGETKPLYVSKMGQKNLSLHFPQAWNYHAVENGETLSLGRRTLTFLETRMLHWPDSMFTYDREDGILFSSDAFGQHYAGPEKFDDEIGEDIMFHARKYFANILLLYTEKIRKLIAEISAMGLDFRMICPDHGIIWRSHPGKIVDAYARWSRHEPTKKAVIIYDSMWHSTERMAEKIGAGLAQEGIPARLMSLRHDDRSEVMTEVLDAGAIVVGSPTLNNNVFPSVMDMLVYMKGLRPKNKIGAAFGSYGWSGEAMQHIQRELTEMKFDMVDPGLRLQYVPDAAGLSDCLAFGRKIGQAVNIRVQP